jgi:hypothetical protein
MTCPFFSRLERIAALCLQEATDISNPWLLPLESRSFVAKSMHADRNTQDAEKFCQGFSFRS